MVGDFGVRVRARRSTHMVGKVGKVGIRTLHLPSYNNNNKNKKRETET